MKQRKQFKKQITGILLAMVMVFGSIAGIVLGMPITARAANINFSQISRGTVLAEGTVVTYDGTGDYLHIYSPNDFNSIAPGGTFTLPETLRVGHTEVSYLDLEYVVDYVDFYESTYKIETETSQRLDIYVGSPYSEYEKVKFSVSGDTDSVAFYSDSNCTNALSLDAPISPYMIYIKGVKPGTATITATSAVNSSQSGTCTVTVVEGTSIALSPNTEQTMTVGEKVPFTATISPENATDKKVKWTVDGTNADAVMLYADEACTTKVGTDATETLTVYAKGISAGSATVTATSNADNTKSASCDVTVNAPPAPAAYDVTITPGSNMTKTETSGAASQTGLSGAMTDVVYTADDGYYFPENYSVTAVNGISVTRDSYTQITVSGTPTADAEVILTAPTAKTTPGAPTTAVAVDCTTADNNDGKLTGVTTAMEYKKSDATEWTAGTGSDITGLVPGTYYVRVKATDTTNASGNQELTIKEFISYTVTFKVVNGKWNEGEGDVATADKTVTLTGHDGDTLKLTADQIPAVGSKPNDTYKAGSWDTTPSAEIAITGATTYTYTYAQKKSISQTVTFKVANGKWDNGTTADKTVTLTGYEGDTLKLAANQIPSVGTKPNDTYKAGSWDVTPSADTAITAATTYTYTYAAKEAAVVTKAPEAKTLTYTGSAQSLVTAGSTEGGEMQYALGTATEATQPYTTSIPAKTDAGTYYVWYMAKGDSNHSDSVPVVVTVTIEKKPIADATVTLDKETLEYTGSEQTVSVTGVKIGDTALVAGTDYEVEGTTKATDAGEYTVKVTGKGNYTNSATADWKILADDEISYTVTFKVVNGSWNDGTAADKEVTVTAVAGSSALLNASDIPAVGEKPADGYKEGSWDKTPSAETAITEDVTYTYTYAKEETVDTVSHTVTFKVVNGSWNDGTAADRTEQLSGVASEALKLSADKIPTVGSKPADGYKEGSWDVVPSAETAITEDVTYTYTYAVTETKIDVKVEEKEDTPAMTVDGLTKELVGNVATEEEQAAINNGENAVMSLEVTNIDQSVSASDKQIMEGAAVAAAPNAQVGMYLDLSMILKVGNRSPRKVTDLSGNNIKAEITVPEKFRAPAGVKRMFYLMSIHNNIPKVLGKSTTFKIPVTLTEFSTYAIVYADEVLKAEGFNTSIKIKQTNGKLVISWDKVEGVKKVDVFLTYCGNEYPSKAVKSTSGNSVTIKKLKGKKLNLKKNLKVYLAAYDSNGNKIGKSISAHFAGKDHKKYTNAKSIKLSDTSVSIAKGGSKKIKATIKLEDKSKKRTSEDHAKAFRYRSTIPGIATVDQDGNIQGVSAGTCEVYVYAQNGLAKKVAVTVTE